MHQLSALIREDIELAATRASAGSEVSSTASTRIVELVDAIEGGDPEEAQRVLLEILSRHHEFVIALYAIGTASSRGTGE